MMAGLSCGEPSLLAWKILDEGTDHFMTITDEDAKGCMKELENEGLETSPSGGAGYAGLIDLNNYDKSCLTKDSNVVIFLTEEPA